MSPSLDKYLCEKYPKIFADRNKPMNETCMCWGFSHSDGWFHLIDRLCNSIQNHVDHPQWVPKKGFIWSLRRGWNRVLYTLCRSFPRNVWFWLSSRLTCREEFEEPTEKFQVVASQVKEKFGGLRFYVNGADNDTYAIIHFAEALSYHICEKCGKMDETVVTCGNGWIRTLCLDCRDNEEKEIHLETLKDKEREKMSKAIAEAVEYRKKESNANG